MLITYYGYKKLEGISPHIWLHLQVSKNGNTKTSCNNIETWVIIALVKMDSEDFFGFDTTNPVSFMKELFKFD